MESPGEYLKRERELRGITLRHISDVTKVHVRYLAALEENRFEALPAEAFTKGFLRSYAKCVGIDPDEAVLAYTKYVEALRQPGPLPAPESSPRQPQLPAPASLPTTKLPAAGSRKLATALLLFFLALAVSFFAFIHSRVRPGLESPATGIAKEQAGALPAADLRRAQSEVSPPSATAPPPTREPGAMESVPAPRPPIPPAGSPSTGVATKISPPPAQARIASPAPPAPADRGPVATAVDSGPPKTLALTITAKEKTWIRAVIDGTTQKEALLPAGTQVTWRAANKFVFVIGNVKGTEMKLNGAEIHIPEGHHNVLRDFTVTRDLIP